MTREELFETLKNDFQDLIQKNDLFDETIHVATKSLSPEEAIGITRRKDFPILTGSEVMIQAQYKNSCGQAFSDAPTVFKGTLKEISELEICENAYNRTIFIATYNALKKDLKNSENVIHCRNDGPELCSGHLLNYLEENYEKQKTKILLVGYQPAMIERLSSKFPLRVLDLNPKNIGNDKYGVKIEHGIDDMNDAIDWAELILCTGSCLCNGSIVDYLTLDKEVLFFGTTISGAADAIGAKRICFSDRVMP